MSLGDILKSAAPTVLGSIASGGNPIVGALLSGIGTVATWGKTKDALRNALLGGLGSAFTPSFSFGRRVAQQAAPQTVDSLMAEIVKRGIPEDVAREQAQKQILEQISSQGIAGVTQPETMSARLLSGLGIQSTPDNPNLLFNLLNTKVGEGVAAGLAATALSKLFDEDEEEFEQSYSQMPFGAGGPSGQLGGIIYAQEGGPMSFPRRTGGIDPSEGSGTKDDVPAMLNAGEFVMTRDAVKGAGGGNLDRGIDRMYSMMDSFERMA